MLDRQLLIFRVLAVVLSLLSLLPLALAAATVIGYSLDAAGNPPAPMKMSGSVFCTLEDFWGNTEWRPCTDAMTRDI